MDKMSAALVTGNIPYGSGSPGYKIFYIIKNNVLYIKSDSVFDSLKSELKTLGVNELMNPPSFFRSLREKFRIDNTAKEYNLCIGLDVFCDLAGISSLVFSEKIKKYNKMLVVTITPSAKNQAIHASNLEVNNDYEFSPEVDDISDLDDF
jgi:hypothetical protein